MTWRVLTAWCLWAAYVLAIGMSLVLQAGTEMVLGGFFDVAEALVLFVFSTTGMLIARRQPRNTVGWLLLLIPVGVAIERLAGAYVVTRVVTQPEDILKEAAVWIAGTNWPSGLSVVLLVGYLPLLYPDGRLLSSRWRAAGMFMGVAASIQVIGASLVAGNFDRPFSSLTNPFGYWEGDALDVLGSVTLLAILVLSATSVVLRFRRSVGRERQQMKWFTLAVGVVLVAMLISASEAVLLPDVPSEVVGALTFLPAIVLLPVSIGVAILRYRLYEIDRLISRTLSYGLLTAILISIYVGLVFLLSAMLPADSQIAVAASTLAAASVFTPLRRRVQELVDRRFYRSRYDTASVSDAFSDRLRNEVDAKALTDHLLTTVARAIHPSHMSLWLGSGDET